MPHSGAHDATLVALSVLIAVVASYTALDLAGRLRASMGWAYRSWLATAALAMGGGIWSMHFVAMLAYSMPGIDVGYDLGLTVASLVLPIVVTAVGFFVATDTKNRPVATAVSGLVMGLGIAGMHYTGMAAMRMPAALRYDRVWVAVSILIAIGAAVAALRLAFLNTRFSQRVGAAVVMGFAISGMHYAAMQGAVVTADAPIDHTHGYASLGQTQLALWVAATTFLILLLALVAAMVDRHFAQRAEREAMALRDSEERFRLLIQGVTDYAIFMLDTEGRVANWNAGAERIKGYRAEEITGAHLSRFYAEEDRRAGVPEKALMTAASRGKFEAEGWRLRKDGTRFWASVVIDAIRNNRNELVGFAKVTRDITERRQAQEALERTQEALFQAQKMEAVGQLTGGLAHDFNNLLAGISGSLELMQVRVQQGRYNDIERYLSAAQDAAKRAAALTHRLLAFSRRQTLDPKPTNVNRLVDGMQDLIQRTVGPAIALEVVRAPGLWPALVDPPQLENALLNLCINARDAMPDGGSITIETANTWLDARAARQHELPEGQYLSLCVTDTGTGMPSEVVARVFEPFFTTKPIGEGTGLGLSMVYGFAQQSGGQVRVSSKPDEGTTVCIHLPRHHGEIAEEDGRGSDLVTARSEQGETVLVVDDEPTVRMLVTDILEDLGYAALEAGDSAGGLKVLESDVRIDLLVTDVGLPGGMNGRQMADAGRLKRPDLKVLFITGYAENAVIGNGHLAPGMAVLTKPFAVETMATRIRLMMAASSCR